jgi:hypothetical protein
MSHGLLPCAPDHDLCLYLSFAGHQPRGRFSPTASYVVKSPTSLRLPAARKQLLRCSQCVKIARYSPPQGAHVLSTIAHVCPQLNTSHRPINGGAWSARAPLLGLVDPKEHLLGCALHSLGLEGDWPSVTFTSQRVTGRL